jgi:hypothetical protein
VGEDAALEEGVELILDEPRQLTAGAGFGVGDETGRVLHHNRPNFCLSVCAHLGAASFWCLRTGPTGRFMAMSSGQRMSSMGRDMSDLFLSSLPKSGPLKFRFPEAALRQ